MKKLVGILFIVLISGCVCSSQVKNRINQDFIMDLASENNRIEGDFSLNEFAGDLSNLTYDYYLTYITKNEAPSAKGMSGMIRKADLHYFKALKESFIIVLYYKNEKTLLCDNSHTPFLDSMKVYSSKDSIPGLEQIGMKFINK